MWARTTCSVSLQKSTLRCWVMRPMSSGVKCSPADKQKDMTRQQSQNVSNRKQDDTSALHHAEAAP